jgi:hypothetical protein
LAAVASVEAASRTALADQHAVGLFEFDKRVLTIDVAAHTPDRRRATSCTKTHDTRSRLIPAIVIAAIILILRHMARYWFVLPR